MMRTMNYFRRVMNELLLDEVFVVLCLSTSLCLLPNCGMMSNYFANYVSVVPVVVSSLYAR